MKRAAAFGLVLLLAALPSCRSEEKAAQRAAKREAAAPRPYQPMGAQAEALRAAFNADAGTVRLVILLAPT